MNIGKNHTMQLNNEAYFLSLSCHFSSFHLMVWVTDGSLMTVLQSKLVVYFHVQGTCCKLGNC